jgi:hypothetical protein
MENRVGWNGEAEGGEGSKGSEGSEGARGTRGMRGGHEAGQVVVVHTHTLSLRSESSLGGGRRVVADPIRGGGGTANE